MSAADWQRLERLFAAAAARPPGERTAFLDDACDGDAELHREIEALLAAEAGADADAFLAEAFVRPPDAWRPGTSAEPGAGETVGAYRLLAELGRGGMGVVFRARRDDGAFEREVAVKVLSGVASPEAARRLEIERQILASLDHPSIARLLDGGTTGGTTAKGSPYVVMELVEGDPIDVFCDTRGLGVEARIELFLRVSDAVAEAHRHLVVHRDLKPSNILVTGDGLPKLLDFGIAKPLDPESLGLGDGDATASWHRLLTPSYASPEQLRGDHVTTATDVYQLGIVLFRLLTGRSPHRLEGRRLDDVERLLESAEAPAPSRILRETAESARPPGVGAIDADLDAVLAKALRADPTARYASVEQFADDLRRRRDGLPVAARAGRMRYRTMKFVRRHWRPLAASAALLLLLTGFAVDRAVRTAELEHALERVRSESERAETVQSFVLDLLRLAEPGASRGETLTIVEALERSDDALARRFRSRPDLEALVRATLGRTYAGLDLLERAEAEHRRALELRREVFGATSTEAAASLADLAEVRLHSDPDEAEALSREALEIGRGNLAVAPRLFDLLVTRIQVLCWRRDYEVAAPLAEEALRIAERADLPRDAGLATAWASQGLILKAADDLNGAWEAYRRSLELFRKIEGEIYPAVADLENQLALLARRREGDAAAVAWHLRALETRRRLYPEGHWEIAQSLYHLAGLNRELGDFAAAEARLAEAIAIYAEDPDRGPAYGRTIDLSLHLAEVLLLAGRPAEAETVARRQLALLPEGIRTRPRQTPWTQSLLGGALAARGRPEEALPLLRESLCGLEEGYGEDDRRVHAARSWLAAATSP